jgi:thiopurine S-methyltransferase
MEAEFWLERWGEGCTAWNQSTPHPWLGENWERQLSRPDGAVFVPLCGKSVDMDWLAAQGHRVVGSELSPIAVAEFFAERELRPEVRTAGELVVNTAADYELWCGDFFDVPRAALDGVVAVYDRASLVALPPEGRRRYAEHLMAIVPTDAPIFLLTFEYDPAEMSGPPFSVTRDEIDDLYGGAYEIAVVETADVFERDPVFANRGLTHLTESLTVLRPAAP